MAEHKHEPKTNAGDPPPTTEPKTSPATDRPLTGKTPGVNQGHAEPEPPKKAADQAKTDAPGAVAQPAADRRTELDKRGLENQPPSADYKLEDINPQAVMSPPDKKLTEAQIEVLASPGLHRAERAWHRHFLNTKQTLDCEVGDGTTVTAAAMLERVQRLLQTGHIKRAADSPA